LRITHQQINKSTNQQINKSTNQQINKSTNQRINKSTNQRRTIPYFLFSIFPQPGKPIEIGRIFALLKSNNQGLTGFDSKDSGIVSMPGL